MQTHLEVMNERLHALFHHGAGWRHELMVINLDRSRGHFVQALRAFEQRKRPPESENTDLSDNSQTLPELLDPTQVAVVAVPRSSPQAHQNSTCQQKPVSSRLGTSPQTSPRHTCRTARPCADPTSRRCPAA